jgi:hypothetical protein
MKTASGIVYGHLDEYILSSMLKTYEGKVTRLQFIIKLREVHTLVYKYKVPFTELEKCTRDKKWLLVDENNSLPYVNHMY